jgi:glycosyltransferase involved in cell wall biosynthesis
LTSTEPTPRTSVVLPIYNQADHLREIVGAYLSALDTRTTSYEIVLVPNGCTDTSSAVAHEMAGELQQIRVVDEAGGGWGRAVKAGLRAARGEMLCYTNSARTTPEILSLMLMYAEVYPDVVVKANRRIRDNWRRRLGSLIYNLECRALFDLSVWDINGTPKNFPRTFDKLLELRRDDDLIDLEFNVVCKREEYPLVEVPILATIRHSGRSTTNYGSAARLYVGAYRLSRDLDTR